ncbi:hypothetical protein HY631_04360 [Candidatus Uhrbacteria bacterium]|nr:hypothetical protein [Candidatus Uhrbacteria bacterium]
MHTARRIPIPLAIFALGQGCATELCAEDSPNGEQCQNGGTEPDAGESPGKEDSGDTGETADSGEPCPADDWPCQVVPLSGAQAQLIGEFPGDYAGFALAILDDRVFVGARREGTLAVFVSPPVPAGRTLLSDPLVLEGDVLSGGIEVLGGDEVVLSSAYTTWVVDSLTLSTAEARLWTSTVGDYGTGDLTGDGFPDLVVGLSHVDVVDGLRTGDASNPDARISGVGYRIIVPGDGDGDGVDDVVAMDEYRELAYLFRGPFAGEVDASASDARWGSEFDMSWIEPVGDIDGDGLPEMSIFSYGQGDNEWIPLILPLREDGTPSLGDALAKIVNDVPGVGLANAKRAGDVDGDGRGDLVVEGWVPSERGNVRSVLFYGPIEGSVSLADNGQAILREDDDAAEGETRSGDIDADGLSDLVFGIGDSEEGAGSAYVLYGGAF